MVSCKRVVKEDQDNFQNTYDIPGGSQSLKVEIPKMCASYYGHHHLSPQRRRNRNTTSALCTRLFRHALIQLPSGQAWTDCLFLCKSKVPHMDWHAWCLNMDVHLSFSQYIIRDHIFSTCLFRKATHVQENIRSWDDQMGGNALHCPTIDNSK